MSLGHYGGIKYSKVMSMGGYKCLIEVGDNIQTVLATNFSKKSDPSKIPAAVTADWKIV